MDLAVTFEAITYVGSHHCFLVPLESDLVVGSAREREKFRKVAQYCTHLTKSSKNAQKKPQIPTLMVLMTVVGAVDFRQIDTTNHCRYATASTRHQGGHSQFSGVGTVL